MSNNIHKRPAVLTVLAALGITALLATACEPSAIRDGRVLEQGSGGRVASPVPSTSPKNSQSGSPQQAAPSPTTGENPTSTTGEARQPARGGSSTSTTKSTPTASRGSSAAPESKTSGTGAVGTSPSASTGKTSQQVRQPQTGSSTTQPPQVTTPPTIQAPQPTSPPTTVGSSVYRCPGGQTVTLWPGADQWYVDTACSQFAPPRPTTTLPLRIVAVQATYGAGLPWISQSFGLRTPESCPQSMTVSYVATYENGTRTSGSVGVSVGDSKNVRPPGGGSITFTYLWPNGVNGACIRTLNYG